MRPVHSYATARPRRLLLLLAGPLTVFGLGVSWRGTAAADTPAPGATPIALPAEGAAVTDSNPFLVTDTMTDTMQLALDAYLAANAEPGLASASGPVEITQVRSVALLPLVVRGSGGPRRPSPPPRRAQRRRPGPTATAPTSP